MEYVDFTQVQRNAQTNGSITVQPVGLQPVVMQGLSVKADDGLPDAFVKSPSVTPDSFSLGATLAAGSAIRQIIFPDPCGMAEKLGIIGGPTAQEFNYVGSYTIDQVREFLKSYALICMAWNFDTSNPKVLKNNLSRLFPKLDEDLDKKSMFTAPTVSNMQYNEDLLNIKQAFVWTNTMALRLNVPAVTAEENVTFTFSFLDAVPYGELPKYLAQAQLPRMHRGLF